MKNNRLFIAFFLFFLFSFSYLFAEKEDFVRTYTQPSHKGSKYEYNQTDVINVFFFPIQDARWNGYEVLDKDWDKLNEIQKNMFVSECTKELERVYNINIECHRTTEDLVVPITQTARILALGGANKKMIEVINMFFESSECITKK